MIQKNGKWKVRLLLLEKKCLMEAEQEKHIPICQSCGMAIAASEHFSTNADLSI